MSDPDGVPLPDPLLALLRGRAVCHIATVMPDGSPQTTLTWVGTDGEHVLVNTPFDSQKVRNVRRDPRVSVDLSSEDEPWRYSRVRGRVVEITDEGADAGIQEFPQRYTGGPSQGADPPPRPVEPGPDPY